MLFIQSSLEANRPQMDGAAKLIDAVAGLAGVFVWPALLLFIVVRYRSVLGDFFSSIAELSWKGVGIEASVKRSRTEAAAELAAAVASRPEAAGPDERASDARAAVEAASAAITSRVLRRTREARVLWVDDRPENNTHERRALETVGIQVTISKSTADALRKIKKGNFDAIISDMGRPPDARAGYTLLDAIRSEGNQTPFLIYAGSRAPEHQAESREHGAIGCTNRPDELFEMVLSAVGRPT